MENIVDAHYFMLPMQGNIYSLTVLNLCSGINKFIMASLKKKIFSFEYLESSGGSLKPIVKEISCTYIPSGAEIISLDAFNKSKNYDDFQIGIAIAKLNNDGHPETYLNIYSEQDPDSNYSLNIDSLAQNCLMIELNFIPYHLTHTFLVDQTDELKSKEVVWLLSGNDCKIHVFQEDRQNHSYNEADISEMFPELTNLPSVVTWIDVHYTDDFSRRLSTVGCECGTVLLFVVNVTSKAVLSTYTDIFDGPISQVKIFSLFPNDIQPPEAFINKDSIVDSSVNKLNLLVCNTLQPSVVYMNVEEGLTEKYLLEGSEDHDVCLCGCIADINMDGCKEILLGTYGQKILMYKWDGVGWCQGGQRSTANPVHGLYYVDLIGDGVNELIVQTLTGVHIMQHEPSEIQRIFFSRLQKLIDEEQGHGDEDRSEVICEGEKEDNHCEEACELVSNIQ